MFRNSRAPTHTALSLGFTWWRQRNAEWDRIFRLDCWKYQWKMGHSSVSLSQGLISHKDRVLRPFFKKMIHLFILAYRGRPYWPCLCKRCWSRWRWRRPPGRSSGLRFGSPDRAPPSEPGGPLRSCSCWWVWPPGSHSRPLYSRRWRHSHMPSGSPRRLKTPPKKNHFYTRADRRDFSLHRIAIQSPLHLYSSRPDWSVNGLSHSFCWGINRLCLYSNTFYWHQRGGREGRGLGVLNWIPFC